MPRFFYRKTLKSYLFQGFLWKAKLTKQLQLMQKPQYLHVSNKLCRWRSRPEAMRTEAREIPFNLKTQLNDAFIESYPDLRFRQFS